MKSTTKYVALDVHQATTLSSVREESGRVIARTILPTEASAIVEFVRGHPGDWPQRGRTRFRIYDNEAGNIDPPWGAGHCQISPQLTALFTSAPILASSAAVNSFSAKEVGHMAPSSRFASSLKPNVAYLDLNFCALWK